MIDESCTALEAVQRMMSLLHRCTYEDGAGDFFADGTVSEKFDCCGAAISYAWKLKRHRPDFNRASGSRATIVDDINVDSFFEDAMYGRRELGTVLLAGEAPRPGDLFITRTIRKGQVKHAPDFTEEGHVRMCMRGPLTWDANHPIYASCSLLQVHGPTGAIGAVITSGQELDNWNAKWPTPDFCVVIVRPHERV